MTRLTVTIPAACADAVNAALVDLVGPEAADTFATADTDDATRLICSWDLAATGHEHLAADIAAVVEKLGVTGTGRTAKTPEILVGPEPAAAEPVTAAALETASDLGAVDSFDQTVTFRSPPAP